MFSYLYFQTSENNIISFTTVNQQGKTWGAPIKTIRKEKMGMV